MSKINLIHGSATEQEVDVIVNAANKMLMSGGGICGAIYRKAGYVELNNACRKYDVPLKDGDAIITPAFKITNAKYIIHAVGPDFSRPGATIDKLYNAYYNSLVLLKENGLKSISFPLISSGIFGGSLENPVKQSVEQCINAYKTFIQENKDYDIEVKICAFFDIEMLEAKKVFENNF